LPRCDRRVTRWTKISLSHRLLNLGILATWLVALLLPALEPEGATSLSGWALLKTGWRGPGVGIWAWYANPLFLLALGASVTRRISAAAVAAGLALILGLTSFAVEEFTALAGIQTSAIVLQSGFFIWFAAILVLWVSTWLPQGISLYRASNRPV